MTDSLYDMSWSELLERVKDLQAEIQQLRKFEKFVLGKMRREEDHFSDSLPYRHWFTLNSCWATPKTAIKKAIGA